MKAYKKFMIIAVALLAAILLVTLCACDPKAQTAEPTPEHTHTFAEGWTHNDEYHWHAATCGHTDETKDKAKHQLSWETTTPATCGTKGVQTGTCVCGYSEPRSIDFAEHSWGKWTSNDNKTHTRTCSNNSAHSETAPCSFDSEVTPPSCKAQGYTTYTCKDCGYSYTSDPTPKTDHIYGSDGTCTECGAPDPSQSAEVSDVELIAALQKYCADDIVSAAFDGEEYDKSKITPKDWYISTNSDGNITKIEYSFIFQKSKTSNFFVLGSATLENPISRAALKNGNMSIIKYDTNYIINYNPTIQADNAELTDAIFEALGVEDTGAERIIIDQGGGTSQTLGERQTYKVVEISDNEIREYVINIKASGDTILNNLKNNLFEESLSSRKTVEINGRKLVA